MAESFLERMLREAREREAKQPQTSPEKPQQPTTPIIPIQPTKTSTEAETASQGQIQPDSGKWDKDEFRNAANVAFVFHNQHVITDDFTSWNREQWDAYWGKCCDDVIATNKQKFNGEDGIGMQLLLFAFRQLELKYNEATYEAYDADQPDEPEAIAN